MKHINEFVKLKIIVLDVVISVIAFGLILVLLFLVTK